MSDWPFVHLVQVHVSVRVCTFVACQFHTVTGIILPIHNSEPDLCAESCLTGRMLPIPPSALRYFQAWFQRCRWMGYRQRNLLPTP